MLEEPTETSGNRIEEEKPPMEPYIPIGSDDPYTPVFFINNSLVDINKDDISVVFSHDMNVGNSRVPIAKVRLVFSHAGFVESVKFLLVRAQFLETIYGGSVPTLSSYSDEQIKEAFKIARGETEETNEE